MEIEANKTRNEIVIYQPDEITRLEVMVENETVWLTQEQIAIRQVFVKIFSEIYNR